jgi:hypothetical protein
MVRKTVTIVAFALCGFAAVSGCTKKEEKKAAEKAPAEESKQVVKKETTVSVPANVKKKWKAVRISITDKTVNKEAIVTVDIGTSVEIQGTGLVISVDNFLPHFVMEGTTLTSQSNEPKNPAVQVRIAENGKEIFKGWLFTLYPTTHAFQHPKYGFGLVDYLTASRS